MDSPAKSPVGFICYICKKEIDPNTERWINARPTHRSCPVDGHPDLYTIARYMPVHDLTESEFGIDPGVVPWYIEKDTGRQVYFCIPTGPMWPSDMCLRDRRYFD